MNNQGPDTNIKEEVKKQKLIRIPKFNYFLLLMIFVLILVGVFGFKKIKKQLKEISNKIEEVYIEEQSLGSKEEGVENSEENSENIKSILGVVQTLSEKKSENDKVPDCGHYLKLISTIVNIRQRVDSGEGFQKEVVFLAILAQKDKKLQDFANSLDSYSESGIANLTILTSEFLDIQNDLILASRIGEQTSDLRLRVAKFFSNLIFIKATGERAIKVGGIEMIVEKVKNNLQEGDLMSAIHELDNITNDNVKKLVSIWILHANEHIAANKLVNELKDYVFNNLNCSFNPDK